MKVVTHDRIAEHLDPHDSGEKLQPITNQFAAMVIILPGEFIFPAKKRPPHAPIDAMHDLNLPVRQHIPPIRPSHAKPPRDRYALNALKTYVSLDPRYRSNETKLTIDGWPRAPKKIAHKRATKLLRQ
jgi:hypothetical protein